jgi:hypothetical protein
MDTVKEYQTKRAIFGKIIPVCFLLFFISLILSFIFDRLEVLWFVLGAASVLVAIAFQLLVNRCPNCGKSQFGAVIIKGQVIRTRGWALNPMSCPWCKVKLNEPHKHS